MKLSTAAIFSGLMLGCWIRQHKFQRFKLVWWTTSWRDRVRGIWAGAPAKVATVTAVFGIVTGTIGVIADLLDLSTRV